MKKRLRKKMVLSQGLNTSNVYMVKIKRVTSKVTLMQSTIDLIKSLSLSGTNRKHHYADDESTSLSLITRKGKTIPITYGMVRKMK